MKVLVTGAAGFVGAHFIQKLQEDGRYEVFAWARNADEAAQIALESNHIGIVDITDARQVEEELGKVCPGYICHLAAQSSVARSWKLPAQTYEINVIGTINLLEAVHHYVPEARILLIGSAEQYGKISPEDLPVSEEHPLEGVNPYSLSKMAQEKAAQLYVKSYGMQIICVRAFNHIGPGQSIQFVVPDWCSQIVEMEKGSREPVLQVGNLDVRRDFTDVRDIVKAYILLLEQGASGECYNVGSGNAYSLGEVLEEIVKRSTVTGIRVETDVQRLRPADIPELRADVRKLWEATGFKPQLTLGQSIQDILEEMRRA